MIRENLRPLYYFAAFGPGGVHALSAAPDGRGGVIGNPARPTQGWDQIMSLPRRLALIGDDEPGRDALAVELAISLRCIPITGTSERRPSLPI